MADNSQQIVWKRAELAVNRFLKTAETDISRLKQFKKNILQDERNGNRSSVKRELSRAQQTISQLRINLDAIHKLRSSLKEDDIPKFNKKMAEARSWILEEIRLFSELDEDLVSYLGDEFHDLLKSGTTDSGPAVHCGRQVQTQRVVSDTEVQLQSQLEVVEDQGRHIDQLVEDAENVRDMMGTLNGLVQEQSETVNGIEENIQTTHANIKQGGINLNKAVVAKTAGYTVIGALCGALVGGPVGLVAGAKLGALAGGAGVAVGAFAGRKIKKSLQKANEVELQNLHVASDMADTRALRQQTVECSGES